MRGRKPKPTATKRLEGNPGKRELPQDEPQPVAGEPVCPEHVRTNLTAWAKWCEVVVTLDSMGLLTTADGDVIAQYCRAYADAMVAREHIAKNGIVLELLTQSGMSVRRNPACAEKWAAEAMLAKLEPELGLTASGRTRLKAKTSSDEDENPLIQLAKIG